MNDQSACILPGTGILTNVSDASREALAAYGETLQLRRGDVLFEQGDRVATLSIVVEGELAVSLHTPEEVRVLSYVHEGEAVGEMGFLEEAEASARVNATSNTTIWRIHHQAFENFLHERHHAGVEILKNLLLLVSRRARKSNERLTDHAAES